MALGLTQPTGDLFPIVKYDARKGAFFRVDRRQQAANGTWKSVPVPWSDPTFLADLHHIEVGWISFASGRPDLRLVPLGAELPEKQDSTDAKQGFRLMIKLPASEGGDIRHFSHTGIGVVKAFDELHDRFLEAPESKDESKVPVVSVADVKPVKTRQGAVNYAPEFVITKWVERPDDFHPDHVVPEPQPQVEPDSDDEYVELTF